MTSKNKGYIIVAAIFLFSNILYFLSLWLTQELSYVLDEILIFSAIPLCIIMSLAIGFIQNKYALSIFKICVVLGTVLILCMAGMLFGENKSWGVASFIVYFVSQLSFEFTCVILQVVPNMDDFNISVCVFPFVQILLLLLSSAIFKKQNNQRC